MRDLLKWLWKRMGLLEAAMLVLVWALVFAATASAQYGHGVYSGGYSSGYSGHGCSPGYCPPSYGYGTPNPHPYYRNIWSKWAYKTWDSNPSYYVHYRTRYDHCGQWYNENDGWLYKLDSYGCYHKHCLISQYASKPPLAPSPYIEQFGGNSVGYDVEQYTIVKKHPFVHQPGVLQGKDLPLASTPQDFLLQPEKTAALRIELAHKAHMSDKDMYLALAQQAGDQESKQEEVRGKLALLAETGRQDERMFAEFKEFLAVRRGQALITADAGQAKIPVDDPALAQAISTKCFSCHGGGKVEGGIDFREADKFDRDQKYAVFTSVLTGEMPKGGTALSREQSEPFRKWYEDSLLASK